MKEWLLMTALVALPPSVALDDYVYKEDPCVEALQGAMQAVDPYLANRFRRDEDRIWRSTLQLDDAGLDDYRAAIVAWEEAKVQCFRH